MNHEIMRGNNYAAQICIDGYDSKILCGRLQSAALDSEMSFGSLMEFFCEMEQLLDQTLPMQAFTERRTFRSVPSAPQQQDHLIPCRLLDLLNAGILYLGGGLTDHGLHTNGVQRHIIPPPSSRRTAAPPGRDGR